MRTESSGIIRNWGAVKESLRKGAEGYLNPSKETEEGKVAKSAAAGLVHSKAGKNRASNILIELSAPELSEIKLLALLLAIYSPQQSFWDGFINGPSSWLASCVAHQLVSGDYCYGTMWVSENSLNSEAFSEQALGRSIRHGVTTVTADGMGYASYDKTRAVRFLVNAVHDALDKDTQRSLDKDVKKLSSDLLREPRREEQEMRVVRP